MPKKYLPFILLAAGILVLVGVFAFVKSNKKEVVVDENDVSGLVEVPLEKRPVLSLTPSSDGHYLKLKVEKIVGEVGDIISFDKVLLTASDDGKKADFGAPYLGGVVVKAKILKQGKARTVRVEKFKRKVRYHKVHGQRQRFTEVTIQ